MDEAVLDVLKAQRLAFSIWILMKVCFFDKPLSTDKVNFYESFYFDCFEVCELGIIANRITKRIAGGIQECGPS
ncbi:MAG: hypothetical protein JXA81_01310 [Sedimentisphaerales bacterium]|nr:hypothetical protein [Sedimentisphaerales bacterium]